MGFCLDGTLAMFSQMGASVDGSIVYYGLPRNKRPPTALEPYSLLDVLSAGPPLLGFWGEEEKSVDLNYVDELDRRLDEFGQPHELVRYPGVGHAFLTFDATSPAYAASANSWARSMHFLTRLSKGLLPLQSAT
jgi:carboxymethylenebutenolidase